MKISATVAAQSFVGFGCLFRTTGQSQDATKKGTIELKLDELSSIMSRSTGIPYDLEYFEYDELLKPMNLRSVIANRDPHNFVHILGLDDRRRPVYEIRELRGVEFLANYQPSDSTATVIANPIEDHGRYALVALRSILSSHLDRIAVDNLVELSSIALQPLTPKGDDQFGSPGRLEPPVVGGRYAGIRYSILERESLFLQDEKGNLRLKSPFIFLSGWCLYVIEGDDGVIIQYSEPPHESPSHQIGRALVKRFSRMDLLTYIHDKPFAHHDWTSTKTSRIKGINDLLEGRNYVDLVLYTQGLKLENGLWKATGRGYIGHSSKGYFLVDFDKRNGKMLITEVIGPVG